MTLTARDVVRFVILAAACVGTARICSAQLLFEPTHHRAPGTDERRSLWPDVRPRPMPTFSSNDRARWATIRALVDEGTYVVGKRVPKDDPKTPYDDSGILFEDGWKTIDRVLHPETKDFYASKPPLLSTLLAGLYWLLKTAFGWTFATHPFAIVRTILLLVNLAPFVGTLYLVDRWAERYRASDWTRVVIVTTAAFGTLATPFLVTLNNHTIGVACVAFALELTLRIWAGQGSWATFAGAGFFSAFAVANEMPALAFAASAFGLMALRSVPKTILGAGPPALAVALAFFGTNYLAIGQWRPAYSEFGSDWYEYPGSHWKKPPEGEIKYGIDWARFHESRAVYAANVLVGHHGLFSLYPMTFLAVIGAFVVTCARPEQRDDLRIPRLVGAMTLAVGAAVIGFYLYKSDNYGGFSNGPRWLMWLVPLGLLTSLPALDWAATRTWARRVTFALLAVSIFSAHYSLWNAWRHPWIHDLAMALGWPGYLK